MRKYLPTYTKTTTRTIACMGDSLTLSYQRILRPDQYWPEQLATKLRALGCALKARNWGHSGHTTTQMLARLNEMTLQEVPDLGIIWGGANDPGNSIAGATTQSNIQAMISALVAAGCLRVLVLNTQYQNFSAGGDTLAVPFATYATLRPFQAAAVTAAQAANPGANIQLVDVYNYMRNLIVAGTETQGSFSWHIVDADQHLNNLGEDYVARAVLAAIQAQTGWVDALKVS
jgi:lysophospholipase L1-like esterase